MMVKCSAPLCSSSTYRKTPEITFHRFPKDEYKKKVWLMKLKKVNWQPNSWSVLCSKHFEEHCIDHSGFRSVLKPDAIPTIFNAPAQSLSSKCIEGTITILTPQALEKLTVQPSVCHNAPAQSSSSKGIKKTVRGKQVLWEVQNLQGEGIVIPQLSGTAIVQPGISTGHIDNNSVSSAVKKLKHKLILQSKKIKLLKQQNRRLKTKVSKFSDIISCLRKKEKLNQVRLGC